MGPTTWVALKEGAYYVHWQLMVPQYSSLRIDVVEMDGVKVAAHIVKVLNRPESRSRRDGVHFQMTPDSGTMDEQRICTTPSPLAMAHLATPITNTAKQWTLMWSIMAWRLDAQQGTRNGCRAGHGLPANSATTRSIELVINCLTDNK